MICLGYLSYRFFLFTVYFFWFFRIPRLSSLPGAAYNNIGSLNLSWTNAGFPTWCTKLYILERIPLIYIYILGVHYTAVLLSWYSNPFTIGFSYYINQDASLQLPIPISSSLIIVIYGRTSLLNPGRWLHSRHSPMSSIALTRQFANGQRLRENLCISLRDPSDPLLRGYWAQQMADMRNLDPQPWWKVYSGQKKGKDTP